MKSSLIITAYITSQEQFLMTAQCLETLDKRQLHEVIVIDPASPMHFDFPSVKVIRQKENNNYSGAVNFGLSQATGDVLIVANNDIEFFDPKWLAGLTKPLREGYDISSIRVSDSDGYEVDDRYEENAKFGSIFAITKQVYKKLGGFDERFPDYFVDLDYRRRAMDMGLKIVKNHGAMVYHKGKATFKATDPSDERYYKGMEIYKEKYGEVE